MDMANVSIMALVVVLLLVVALFIIVKSFKLPASYFNNEKARSEIRKQLMEKEHEEKRLKNADPPDDDPENRNAEK
jgi:hypothetical protein